MNLDLTMNIGFRCCWARITLFEIDIDKKWGFSLGILRISGNKSDESPEHERSLLFINKTTYMYKFDLLFLKIIEKYK